MKPTEFIGDLRGAVRFKAKAVDTNIAKGDAVYISGIDGNTPTVGLADADNASKMPAFGLAAADINENATGEIITFGTLSGVDTSSFSVGDILYIDTSPSIGSTLTATAPAGESAQIQNIGKVQRSHASAGSIKVGGAGRSNATPNLNQDKIFLGDSNNRAVSTALSSIGLTSFNNDAGFVTSTGDNTFVTSASFNTGDGVLTLTRNDTNTVTVDLDSRYLELGGGTLTGDLTVGNNSTDRRVRVHHSDNAYTEMRGYGIQFNRTSSYIRPTSDNDKNMYFGTDGKTWANISFDATAVQFSKNDVDYLTISSGGDVDIANDLDVGGTLTLDSVSTSVSGVVSALFHDQGGIITKRTLGSNAFNSDTIPTNNNQLTNGGWLFNVIF